MVKRHSYRHQSDSSSYLLAWFVRTVIPCGCCSKEWITTTERKSYYWWAILVFFGVCHHNHNRIFLNISINMNVPKKRIWFKSSTPFFLINDNIFPMFRRITYFVLSQEVRQHASLFLPLISEDQPPQIARPSFTVVTIFTIFAFFWEFPSPALPWQPLFGEPEVQISQRAWLQVWIFGS